jgi:cation/acetate symporter
LFLVAIGPTVWVDAFHNPIALNPIKNPALPSMSIAFIGVWLISILDKSASAKKERAVLNAQYVHSETGMGANEASTH